MVAHESWNPTLSTNAAAESLAVDASLPEGEYFETEDRLTDVGLKAEKAASLEVAKAVKLLVDAGASSICWAPSDFPLAPSPDWVQELSGVSVTGA